MKYVLQNKNPLKFDAMENSASDNQSDINSEIKNIVKARAARCSNFALASQLQKAVPDITEIEKRGSLHVALQEMSKCSLSNVRGVSFQLPKQSLHTAEVTMEEYNVPESENELLRDRFVKNLPVPIKEKRYYRKSIVSTFKRKPRCTQIHDYLKRYWSDFISKFYIWNDSLKIIEGRHGAAIVAYFVFIRWMLFMNLVIFLLNFFFLLIPQIICSKSLFSPEHNVSYVAPKLSAETTNYSIQGPLESTYLFLGSYTDACHGLYGHSYSIASASLFVLLATLIICLIMMIMFSTVGIQESFLIQHKRSNYYSNEVFCAWNFGIDNPKSAAYQHNKFVLDIKNSLNEDRKEREISARSTLDWAKLYAIRFAVNVFIILWLWTCFFVIYKIAVYQLKEQQKYYSTELGFQAFFLQYITSFSVVIFNGTSPVVFFVLVTFEKYSDQTETSISLFRNIFLSLSSFIVLLSTLYRQIACSEKDVCGAGNSLTCNVPRVQIGCK